MYSRSLHHYTDLAHCNIRFSCESAVVFCCAFSIVMRAAGGWRLVQNCISAVVVKSIETLRSTLAECPRTPRSTLEAPIQPSAMLVLAQLFTAAQCFSLLFLVLLFSVWSKGSYTYNPVSELHLSLVRTQLSMRRRCPKRRGMRGSVYGD